MALENFTVVRRQVNDLKSRNYAGGETQAYDTARVIYAIPSISKDPRGSNPLVLSEVLVDGGERNSVKLWVSESVSTIEALDD